MTVTIPGKDRRLKVFLCHTNRDKPEVRKIYRRLQDEGVQPWLDEEDLLPGQRWQEVIPIEVRSADAIIVCLSQHSISKEGYVQKEIALALDIVDEKPEGTIYLIPVRLEACTIPQRLAGWQYLDLFKGEASFEKLLQSLQKRARDLGGKSDENSLSPAPAPAKEQPKEARSISEGVNIRFACTVTRSPGWFSDGHAPYPDTLEIDRRALLHTVLKEMDYGYRTGGGKLGSHEQWPRDKFLKRIATILDYIGCENRPRRTTLYFRDEDIKHYFETLESMGLFHVLEHARLRLSTEGHRLLASLKNNHIKPAW
ncbi:MAG TPA: toll/interleukin-1 receptor domain-containing protein [Candidatus Angelobacter sp.]|jgi:nucleotide-binding universal stress UspA family protein